MIEWLLRQGEVHCWVLALDKFVLAQQILLETLAPDERQRAGRCKFDKDRLEYVICRGALRMLLARYLVGSASQLRFVYSSRGKPELHADCNPIDLRFNVAHSHGAAVIAVTRGRAIGVDIEWIRPLSDLAGLVRHCFAAEEQDEFASLPDLMQPIAFFAGWTRKEAFIKATGEGLSRSLHSFAVTLSPGSRQKVLRVNADRSAGVGWTLLDITEVDSCAAAVAVHAVVSAVRTFELVPEVVLRPQERACIGRDAG